MRIGESNPHVHRLCFGRIEQIGQIEGVIDCCECSGHECHNGVFDHMVKSGIAASVDPTSPHSLDDGYEVSRMEKWADESAEARYLGQE